MRALQARGRWIWPLMIVLALLAASCAADDGGTDTTADAAGDADATADDSAEDEATDADADEADGGDDAATEVNETDQADDAEEVESGPDAAGDAGELLAPDEVALSDDQVAAIRDQGLTFAINTNNNTDDFSSTVVAGAQAAADTLGIELISQSADFDAATQLSQLDALIQQGVDAIFLIAVDADAVSTGILAANEADIPVLVVGGPPSRGEVVTVLNADSYEGTLESASLMAEAIGDGGTAALLQIPLALAVIEDRDRGAAEGLTGNGIEIVAEQGSFEQEELLAQAESILQANPDLGGIYATWSLAINAALAATEGTDVLVTGHDAERTGFEALDEGNPNLIGLTAQQPYAQGQTGIAALSRAILGESVPADLVVPNLTVTPDNYRDQWDVLYPGITPPWEG